MAEPLAMGWTGHLAKPHLHTLLSGALRGRAQVVRSDGVAGGQSAWAGCAPGAGGQGQTRS